MKQKRISVIIPVINEEKILSKIINNLKSYPNIEVIFVDGGSKDKTINLIKKSGFKWVLSPILRRSYQMNLGAEFAQGDILLFLHSDTILPPKFTDLVNCVCEKKDFIAGAFYLKIASNKSIFRWLEILIKVRSHLFSLPYGDQGIFLTKETFTQLKGYRDLAIMEDFDIIQRLKKKGKIYLVKDAVITSARRWEKLGILQTTLINQIIIIGYYLGINSEKLAKIYRQYKK